MKELLGSRRRDSNDDEEDEDKGAAPLDEPAVDGGTEAAGTWWDMNDREPPEADLSDVASAVVGARLDRGVLLAVDAAVVTAVGAVGAVAAIVGVADDCSDDKGIDVGLLLVSPYNSWLRESRKESSSLALSDCSGSKRGALAGFSAKTGGSLDCSTTRSSIEKVSFSDG